MAAAATLPAVAQEPLRQVDSQGRTVFADRVVPGARIVTVAAADAAAPATGAVPVPVQPSGLQGAQRRAPATVARTVAPSTPGDAQAAVPAGRQTMVARRSDVRWSGETDPGSMTAAYVELEAARVASEEAEARLRAAVLPQAGETVRRPDGSVRYLPAYYERVAPFEREAMMAQERLERADLGLRIAR
jgi:hypothetical protein